MSAEDPQATVYLVLSYHGKIADSSTDLDTAQRRASGIGGMVVDLPVRYDFRPARGDRTAAPPPNPQPFRPIPDVR